MDETISEAFFRWVDENESDYDFPIMFESCESSVLSFQIESEAIKINFKSKSASTKSKQKIIQKWVSSLNNTIQSKISDFYDFFNESFSHYSELKEFSSEEEDPEEDNYHEQIKETMLLERMQNLHITGEAPPVSSLSFYKSHFVYKEAEEAIRLLSQTLAQAAKYNYSLNIRNNQAFCNIRLELDLAFLQIPDSVMIMLGLNYENPLVVSCSMSDIRLSQTLSVQEWTPSLLGFLDFEVLQAGFGESYGCKTYIKGRVEKFRENMYKLVSSSQEMGSYLTLSRENSEDVQVSTPGIIDRLLGTGSSKKKVKEAIKKAKNDETKALELLQLDTFANDTGELANIILPCNNFFYNLLFYLRDRIQNCTNYCYICYKRHVVDSVRLRPCSADICEFRFEEISGISVYAEICNNPELVQLDLSFAAESALSGRNQTVFEPFPSFLLKKEQIRGKAGFLSGNNYTAEMDQNKDIQRLRELAAHMPDVLALKTMCGDENSCRDFICSQNANGLEIYKLIRYIIATNRLNFIQLKPEDAIPQLNEHITQYIVTNHAPETLKQFAAKKSKHGSVYAFHGSSLENWYSILRNGIRNLSNTHLMTAGAAYGAGVYCAENFSTSLGYCRFGTTGPAGWPFSLLNGKACMAIIEVIKTDKINKGNGIYVVTDDKDIIIRYLLVLSSGACNRNAVMGDLQLEKHYDKVMNKYMKASRDIQKSRIEKATKKAKEVEESLKKPQEEEKISPEVETRLQQLENNFTGKGSTMANKRILQEYKYLICSKECKGLSAEFDEANIYVWTIRVDIKKFEVNKELRNDFNEYAKRYNRELEMVFEMRFDSNYPYNPPFLRVLRPRFAFRTGHVTVGGSICMQSITKSGWIPVRTVESIFIEILFNMAEGGARLDLNGSAVDYGLGEAQEAFERVAKQHNWI